MKAIIKLSGKQQSEMGGLNSTPLRWIGIALFSMMLESCGGNSEKPQAVNSPTTSENVTMNNWRAASSSLPVSTATVPAAPSGLFITSGNGEVALSWNDVAGATSYNVYYLTYPGVTISNSRQLTQRISGDPITGLSNTVTYYFVVTAVNADGESLASAEISSTPMPALPGIPGNVRLTGGLGEATLSWQVVPNATSYNVYYGTSPGLNHYSPLSIKGIKLSSQKITGLNAAPGHYYFRVTAVDDSGEGDPSVEVSAVAKSAYRALAAGYGYSMAVRIIEPVLKVDEGTVWQWGDNSSGQLGTGGAPPERITAEMTPTLSAVTQLASGYHHAVVLKTDNSVMAWGLNNKGQLGDNHTTTNTKVPMHPFAPYVMQSVAAGYQHSAAIDENGTVWTWGYNLMGALGYKSINCENPGDYTQPLAWSCSYTPTQVTGITGTVKAIAAGFDHTLAVAADGRVWAWGRNDTGQLGNSGNSLNCPISIMMAVPQDVGFTSAWATPDTAHSCSTNPVEVTPPLPGAVIAVAAGTRHSVALMSDGTVWTWGGNYFGQLGYSSTKLDEFGHTLGVLPTEPFGTDLANCVITSAFQMRCTTTPARVPGLDHIVAIAAGSDHTVALKGDGTVWQWGMDLTKPTNFAAFVNPDTPLSGVLPTQTPTRVAGLTGITTIAAGSYHTLALKNNGTVWAWGYNGHGQLGNNTRTDSAVPVQVQGLLGPVVVIPGR
ncbi:MAG: hypothetical protein WC742_13125 [Gallionellaceae bacterium]|jgi:YD repeat-containing protein